MNKIQMKEWLKENSALIRELKNERNEAMKNGGADWKLMSRLDDLRDLYRTHHIAYSLSNGNKYEDIESNPTSEPRWFVINELLEILGEK